LISETSQSDPENDRSNSLSEQVLRSGFDVVTGVPDSPLAALASSLERTPERYFPGTREDACVAWAAGAQLAGRTPLVFMKSAGFANCLDSLTSLVEVYRIPMVLLISWAGHAGRDVPHHNVIGEPLEALLDALGIPVRTARMDDPRAVGDALATALLLSRERRGAAVVLGIPEGLAAA